MADEELHYSKPAGWPLRYPQDKPMINQQDLDWLQQKWAKKLAQEAQRIEDVATSIPRHEYGYAEQLGIAKGLRKAASMIAEKEL